MYVLFERTHFEEVHLLLGQITPAATGQVLLGKPCEIYAVELGHMVAERLEDTAHNAVTSRMNLDSGLVAVGFRSIGDCTRRG